MSVGCSTTQSNSVEREESPHISQISLAAKNPHKLHGRIAWRVSPIARAICSALESRGLPCWISSRDVGLGENFMDAIVRAIGAAKVMVLVFSENANNSDDMKREIVLASSAMVTVIPVRVEDVVPKGAFAYQLATRQWIDLFQDWEDQIERLAKWIATTAPATSNAQANAGPIIPVPDRPAIDTDLRPQEKAEPRAGEENCSPAA